jgi:hypothetical protein
MPTKASGSIDQWEGPHGGPFAGPALRRSSRQRAVRTGERGLRGITHRARGKQLPQRYAETSAPRPVETGPQQATAFLS